MATYKQLSDGNPDGTILGQSASDLIGFYGTTPAAQPAHTADLATFVSTIAVSTAAAGVWGFQTSTTLKALGTNLKNVQTTVNTILANLRTLGLKASS